MYNPYEALRRRPQTQTDLPVPQFQQPAPMSGIPFYSGPELPQWTPMGDDSGQMRDAGAGMASLIKRFKPKSGSLGEHGPRG